MGAKEVITEIFERANSKTVTARVGLPDQPLPVLTSKQNEQLERASAILKGNSRWALWRLYIRTNPQLQTQESRGIGGDTYRTTISEGGEVIPPEIPMLLRVMELRPKIHNDQPLGD